MTNKAIKVIGSKKSLIPIDSLASHIANSDYFKETKRTPLYLLSNLIPRRKARYTKILANSLVNNKDIEIHSTTSCTELHETLKQLSKQYIVNIIDVNKDCFTESFYNNWKSGRAHNPEKWIIALVEHFNKEGREASKIIYHSSNKTIEIRKSDVARVSKSEKSKQSLSFEDSNLPQIIHTLIFKPKIALNFSHNLEQEKIIYIKKVIKHFFGEIVSEEQHMEYKQSISLLFMKNSQSMDILFNKESDIGRKTIAIFWNTPQEQELINQRIKDKCSDPEYIFNKLIIINSRKKESVSHLICEIDRILFDRFYYINELTNYEDQPFQGEKIATTYPPFLC